MHIQIRFLLFTRTSILSVLHDHTDKRTSLHNTNKPIFYLMQPHKHILHNPTDKHIFFLTQLCEQAHLFRHNYTDKYAFSLTQPHKQAYPSAHTRSAFTLRREETGLHILVLSLAWLRDAMPRVEAATVEARGRVKETRTSLNG